MCSADDSTTESSFSSLEQRVPLAEGSAPAVRGNVAYSGQWSVEKDDALVGKDGTMVLAVPANVSMFALSGARGAGYGRYELAFSPPILRMRDYASETDLAVEPHEATLFAAPLDPAVLYTVNITSRGARLRALHYWPVSECVSF